MPPIPEIRDDWKLVEVKPSDSDELWLFRKNMGAAEIKGIADLPTLVYFTVQFTPRDSSGLPTEEDAERLYDFEEIAIPVVEEESDSIMVASVVKGGLKDHLFYTGSPDRFAESLGKHRDRLEGFQISLEKHDDPEWEIFDDFPDGEY